MSLHERRKEYADINMDVRSSISDIELFISNMGFLYSGGTVGGDKRSYMSRDEKGSSLNITITKERCIIEGKVTKEAAQQFNKYKTSV